MPEDAHHILILSSWYPSEKHPFLGNFVQRHAQLLSTKYRVSVINLICSDTVTTTSVSTEMDAAVTEIKASYPNGSKLTRYSGRSKVFGQALKTVGQVDLIIGHVLLPYGWMFINASKSLKCPFIWVEHGSYFRSDEPRRWSMRERLLRRSVISQSSEIIAVSERLKSDLQPYVSSKEIKVIGNHIDENLFQCKEKNNAGITKFLHVSTLDNKTKNPFGILEACLLLKSEGYTFQLTIVSDEDASELQNYVRQHDLQEEITFEGPQDWQSMPQFYHEADAFILNSTYETFSIVLAESLSTGTPVITTEVGIASQIPAFAKIPVETNSVDSLKRAMQLMIENEQKFDYQEIATLAKRYHSTEILSEWSKVIEQHVK